MTTNLETDLKAQVATARTFDGSILYFYADGMVTSSIGYGFGRGTGACRSAESIALAVRANWLVAGEVSLYDFAEVPTLIQVARRYVAQCAVKKTQPLSGEYRRQVAQAFKK